MQHFDLSTGGVLPPPLGAADRLTLSAGQVALLLGVSEAGFRAKRVALEALGFPGKLPGFNKWSRAAVTRWVETNGVTAQPAELDASLSGEAAKLEQLYGGAQ